ENISLSMQGIGASPFSLTVNTSGDVNLRNSFDQAVTWLGSTAHNFTLTSFAPVTNTGNQVLSGVLTINTNSLTNVGTLTAQTININGVVGTMTVANAGLINANGFNGSVNISSASGQNLIINNNGAGSGNPGIIEVTGGGTAQINILAPLP